MRVDTNFASGNQDKPGWVRIGHNSTFTNPEAVWTFAIIPTGEQLTAINSLRFNLSWNNGAVGTGWSGSFLYWARIRSGSVGGHIVKEVGITLNGSSGSCGVELNGLGLEQNKTYWFTFNVKDKDSGGAPLSTMKQFSTAISVNVLSYEEPGQCTPPVAIKLNGAQLDGYAKPGNGVQMEIIGGGSGRDNPFQRWYIQELVFVPGQGELTGWRNARNGNDQEDSAVYNPINRIVTVYPTLVRGQNKRFRIRAEGIPLERYHSTLVEMGPRAISNRLPNTCTGLTLNKTRAIPGETIRLSFSGGGDPDNNLARYQVRAYDESGA